MSASTVSRIDPTVFRPSAALCCAASANWPSQYVPPGLSTWPLNVSVRDSNVATVCFQPCTGAKYAFGSVLRINCFVGDISAACSALTAQSRHAFHQRHPVLLVRDEALPTGLAYLAEHIHPPRNDLLGVRQHLVCQRLDCRQRRISAPGSRARRRRGVTFNGLCEFGHLRTQPAQRPQICRDPISHPAVPSLASNHPQATASRQNGKLAGADASRTVPVLRSRTRRVIPCNFLGVHVHFAQTWERTSPIPMVIDYCPARAFNYWLIVSGVEGGVL